MTQPTMPPSAPPPPPPSAAGTDQSNRNLLLVLSYLWLLAIIPLIAQKDDPEVQWHAKHGLVLFVVEFLLCIVFGVLTSIPILGCIVGIVWMIVGIGIIALHIMCILKALNGQRFLIPGISDFANRF